VFPNGDVLRAEGTFEGEIGYAPAGENGFGYDPIFVVGDRTSAEMSSAEKDAMSHRGNALRVFSKDLAAYLAQNK
jgi:XTP/dITP diphosphohydrolase